jgi:hypothetical protein
MESDDDRFISTGTNVVNAFGAVGSGAVAYGNTSAFVGLPVPPFQWGGSFIGSHYGCASVAFQTNDTDWPPVDGYSNNAGLVGASTEFTGVGGISTWGAGVYGRKSLPDEDSSLIPNGLPAGVVGASISFDGVNGWSNYGDGVLGQTQAGDAGVVGVSSFTRGVLGVTPGVAPFGGLSGVEGRCGDAGPSPPPAVDGLNLPSIAGVFGTSDVQAGVIGTSNSSVGVLGFSNSYYAGVFLGDFLVMNGSKSVAVPFPDGSHRVLYCMESPELWFEDFGAAKLKAGRAVVKLDADFAKVIKRGDYKVFLTPEGECRGLYVRKSAASFEVREFAGGKSSIAFSYRIVGRRKDITEQRFAKVIPPKLPAAARAPRKPTTAQLRAFVARVEKEARARVRKGAKKGRRRPNLWIAKVAGRTAAVPRARTK